MKNTKISYPPITVLPQFESANKERGGAGVWAGDLEVGAESVGSITSITWVLAVTRWSLPWNRYVMLQ